MDKEVGALREEAIKMCWWMRGGMSLTEALDLSKSDREAINRLIKENLETTKKTKMPFF